MSTYSLPAGIEAWRKCPIDGCFVDVYGPLSRENRCREHGGAPAFQQHTDAFGIPTEAERADPPPPVPAR